MRKLKLLFAACALVAGSITVSAAIVSGTTYYLQNKASGRFISSGHGWFTRSTLSPVLDYPIQLNSSGDGYILKIVGSNQLGHNLYVDNSNNNVWTITAVEGEENVYTIANGTNYLGSDGSFILSGSLTDATSDAAKWYIRSKDDYLSMFTSASAENPVDASFYITGPSYDYTDTNRDNKWTMDGFGAGTELTRGSGTTAINPYVVERYNGTGSIKQKLTGLKKGMYGVSVYGFYRAGNNNAASASRTENTEAQNAIIFAGTKEKPLKSIYDDAQASAVAGSFDTNTSFGFVPNLRSTAGECFANGYYKNTIYVYIDSDGAELEIGVKKDATIAEDWAIIDNWCMTYYGSEELTETEIILAASVKTYKEALAAAQAYQSADMFDTDKTALNTAINNNIIDLSGNVTEEQLITAANNLNAAAANAAKDVARYNTYTTAVSTINSGENVDLTSLIVNPSFENNFTGWTNTGSMAIQGNTSFGKTGNNYVEFWQPNGTKGVSQTIDALPSGLYSLTVKVKARGVTSAKVFAAGINQAVTIADAENEYTVNFALDDKSSTLIGFEGIGTGAGNSWLALDNFRLTYIGELPNELTAVTGKMNSTVDADQTSAINAYNSNQTVANYNAAQSAIAAAQASVAAYTLAATAIADANAVKTNQNFATAAAITAFENAIQAIQDKYDNGTLTNDEANNAGLTLGVGMSGVRTNPTGAAIQYMNSGFGLTNFDAALYVNTWSTEGANDGSNFTFPFYEYWVSEANSLGANTWIGTLTGLENGLYEVSALVRVRAKNDVAAADASGITMKVTSGDAVDVTKGTQIGEGQFLLKEYTAEGLVKDGNLVLNFNIAADNNISWLSFKNIKYNKVRDLTPDEMAVVPADLAIDATRTIYKGKTATLTPTSTTAGASIDGYVSWASDNTSVATVDNNGVVTAVGYGTANITVTSTLNSDATATCAVTVDAPTYDQLENLDFAEGPLNDYSIITTTADLGKVGNEDAGAANMQAVTGWSITENGDNRAAGVMKYNSGHGLGNVSNTIPTEGPDANANDYALAIEAVWGTTAQYTQNVLLPAGAYTITVPIYNLIKDQKMSKNLIGFIADDNTEYLATATNYDANTWTTETVKFTLTQDTYGKLSLGFTSSGQGNAKAPHLFIDRVTIACEPFATEAEIVALDDAIDAAEDYTLGFAAGEYAPYNNVAALKALAAAKAIDTTIPVGQSVVTDATAALTAATWTANTEEVNAIYDGTFAAATNNGAPAGWSMSNNTIGNKEGETTHPRAFVGDERLSEFNSTNSAFFIRFDGTYSNRGSLYYYGNTEGYTMPLAADTYYRVTVDFAGWGSTGKPLRLNVTGPEGFSAVSQEKNTNVRADNADNAPQQFNILFKTAGAGNYVIYFQTPGSDTNTHNAVISNLKLFTEPETNVTMAISDAKFATFIAPFDVEIPSGVTAYTVDGIEGNKLSMTKVETTITANTPVVLNSESTVNQEFAGYAVEGSTTNGLLTGVYAETDAPVGSYVLQKQNDVVGFYKVVESKQPKVDANRAYLTVNSSARALYFDGATAIKAVEALTSGEAEIYNAAGARQNSLQKGVNIIKQGNKTYKVMVK